jgi:hypothetical protein
MSFPENTIGGVAAVLNARSAWPAVATISVAVAELAPKDWFAALTVTVSLMIVPLAVPAFTLYTTVKVPLEPAGTLGLVHWGGNAAHVQPAGAMMVGT